MLNRTIARLARQTIGSDAQLVTFEAPGAPMPDGDGGFTEDWQPLSPPTWYVRIRPITARDQEDLVAGTVITHVSHIVHGRYHPQISTRCRMLHAGQVFQVTGVENVELRNTEMILVAELQQPDVAE